ncbi:glycosyl hydrolase [Novosphingobium album (ex Hu et al. 2023)]|uniref:Glycoside hydrolase n=1 Tax=Novosphingobium album (ex Hu et al. 2023) TaxID=2930093 RepID=A0ABT0B609_9SPHN|nr:glycosyl hydrolase [Novosphingobium album (ex Hu et al. 2023)]MCJ2180239.1 glycoside hydrolase [Novosphingobium album (ex Hu et al. 2023)]
MAELSVLMGRSRSGKRPAFWAALLATAAATAGLSASLPAQDRAEGALQSGRDGQVPAAQLPAAFRDPPRSARPRVWWHWLNGNITRDGIAKDLDWMERVGIGGVQTFDVNLATPKIVDERLLYMTPQWQDAFRYATGLAAAKGMELTIAASPGWSETGGPWVPPGDGMKKLVWSEMTVQGGQPFSRQLPPLPTVTGPFQDMPVSGHAGQGKEKPAPTASGEIGVYAYRVAGSGKGSDARALVPAVPVMRLGDGTKLDAGALVDGSYKTGLTVPRGPEDAPTIVDISYGAPQTIRSATIFVPSATDLYAPSTLQPRLEASPDGVSWQVVAHFHLGTAPTTISFAPVTASKFRVVLAPAPNIPPYGSDATPGYDLGPFAKYMGPQPTMKLLELSLSPSPRINQFEAKAGFSTARDYEILDVPAGGGNVGVPVAAILDLTRKVRPDGTLDWTPPKGEWRVIRMGWSLTGTTNHPAPEEATGLEVDKLDSKAVRRYLESYIGNYQKVVGADRIGAQGINALLTDSTEVGAFNWTPDMLAQFQRLRGYDARPWLPTLTGVIIGSREQSNRFLDDFRRTIAELHATEHYKTVAEVAHEHGLKVYGESLEGWRTTLGDDLDMRRYADFPMGALWYYRREVGPKPFYATDMRGAASVAHVYGQNIAAAESLTTTRQPWDQGPADLKRVVDWEFLNGINRISIHSSAHQPVDDKQPGISMGHIGQYFNRHETWAEMARPWIDYIGRSSLLLQQGRFVADVAYYYGEEAPVGIQTQDGYFTDVPHRNGYDFVSAEMLNDVLKVEHGDLVAPGGARYKLLYLSGRRSRMSLAMLQRLADLAEAGATILGNPPSGPLGLAGDRDAYAALIGRLWSGQPVTTVGKGRVIAGKDVDAALKLIGDGPDVSMEGASAGEIPFVHRKLDDADIYFLANRSGQAQSVQATFRVTGKAPEIWRAETGEARPLSYTIKDGGTAVPLHFDSDESYFVVFRKDAKTASRVVSGIEQFPAATLGSAWKVTFQPERGAPAGTTMPALAPLNDNADPGIRYFSGVATYSTTFTAPAGYRAGQPLTLDLGKVGVVARVRVNGKDAGTAWHAPYRVDIGATVMPGINRLEVDVANLWVNRLIGDRQPGGKPVAWTVKPMYLPDAQLRPSGLIGPVQLLQPGVAAR